jgi:predicted ATPase
MFMLTNLQLQNFKIWKNTGQLKMAPLTVLFGTNSSGKSSIEQFFLMLKQTMESSDRKIVIYPGDQNSPVNLGSFEELVFARDPKNRLEFNFEWSLAAPLTVKDPRSDFSCSGNHVRFSADVGMAGEKHPKLSVSRLEYQLKQDHREAMRVWVERKAGQKVEYKLDATPYTLTRNQMRAWPLGAPTKFYGFPDEIPAYYQNADFVQDFSLQMEQLLRSISYLGPLRSKGQRLYYWTGGEPESVGYSGENTISALLAAKTRQLNTGRKKRRKPFEQFIAEKLHQLELIDEFEVRQISEHRKEYEVKVKTPGSPSWVDLPDVGFGVSQVLPVLVQCFYAPADSILFIEQPELHLHPKAQSNLADLFIDVLSSRVDGKPRNIQLVIETHSEHLLHRLQRRIAENDPERIITPEQVAAYFAHTAGIDSKLEPLQIDLFGNIINWPENFFGDSMGDLMAMTRAAAGRQQAQATPPNPSPATE